jgi:hypothetical protein
LNRAFAASQAEENATRGKLGGVSYSTIWDDPSTVTGYLAPSESIADHHHRNLSDKLQTVSYTFQKSTPTNLPTWNCNREMCQSREQSHGKREKRERPPTRHQVKSFVPATLKCSLAPPPQKGRRGLIPQSRGLVLTARSRI